MKIAIGNDHAAIGMKNQIVAHLEKQGYTVVNYGINEEKSCDYPVYGYTVAKAVASGECDLGVLICGTGLGISLAANKVPGIRACVCSEPYTASMAVKHNNCQIVSMGARVIGRELAKMIVDTFFSCEFEGGRHQNRVDMISQIEKDYGKA